MKNLLIPEIEKTVIQKTKNDNDKTEEKQIKTRWIKYKEEKKDKVQYYKTIMVSLYGVSSIENIQSAIYICIFIGDEENIP